MRRHWCVVIGASSLEHRLHYLSTMHPHWHVFFLDVRHHRACNRYAVSVIAVRHLLMLQYDGNSTDAVQ